MSRLRSWICQRFDSSRVSFKKNKENPIHETDALAELLMLPALILLVSELPDSLSTDTITPTGALSHEWKNIKNRLQKHTVTTQRM